MASIGTAMPAARFSLLRAPPSSAVSDGFISAAPPFSLSHRRRSLFRCASLRTLRPDELHKHGEFIVKLRSRSKRIGIFRCFSALTPQLKDTLDKVVTSNKVVLFMKGTKDFPQCGFSNTVVQILKSLNVPFETVNILENELLRQALKEYSSWPTFPQLYIDGEFFGGCDITVEAYQSGELQELLEKAMCS